MAIPFPNRAYLNAEPYPVSGSAHPWWSMATFEIKGGHVVLLDDKDLPLVQDYKWYARPTNGNIYAKARLGSGRSAPQGDMPRVIMNPKPGQFVDHINGNGLDNRRANLRICRQKDNARNCRRPVGASGYRGVRFRRDRGSWVAHLSIDNKEVYVGSYASADEAARARDEAALKHHGQFAVLNFA